MNRFSGYPPRVFRKDSLKGANALHVDFLLSDSGCWSFFSWIARTHFSEVCHS